MKTIYEPEELGPEPDHEFELWVMNNFYIALNYGTAALDYTPNELLTVKKFWKKHSEVEAKLPENIDYLYRAIAALIHNVKGMVQYLTSREKNGLAKNMESLRYIAINQARVQDLTFYIDGKGYKITDPAIIKNTVTNLLKNYPPDNIAEIISNKVKTFERDNNGIPSLVNELAFGLDGTFKNLIPGITTHAIIRDILEAVGLIDYTDVKNIYTYIQRGNTSYKNDKTK